MGRYFAESEATEKVEIFNVSSGNLSKAKSLSRRKRTQVKALKYSKGAPRGIKKRKSSDPFPGRKPIDPAKIEEHAR